MMTALLFILFILIAFVLTGLFSGYEMAYLSCNKLRLRHLSDQGDKSALEAMEFHQNPKRFLTTVLLGNNLTHVTIVGLSTYLFETYFHIYEEWIIASILALPIIIFAETIPKDLFRHKADDYIYRFAPVVGFLNRLFSGLSDSLVRLTDVLIQRTTGERQRSPMVTRDEFRYVIEESAKGGVLHEHEKQLIHTILNLSSVQVSDVMVKVAGFPKVSLTSRVRDIKDVARRTKTDAMLVYEEIPSIVVGMIYVFDVLFEEEEDLYLTRFLKSPLFIPQNTSAERAIFLLQLKHASYGAVINPDREVIGVVRLENLIQVKPPIQPFGP